MIAKVWCWVLHRKHWGGSRYNLDQGCYEVYCGKCWVWRT